MASTPVSIVLSSLQAISDSPVRYLFHLSEESGGCCCCRFSGSISFWVVFSSDGSEMPALPEASDSINIGDARPFRSTFKVRIRFDMRFVVPFKNYKVSSSRRVSVSSCKLGEFLCVFMQRWFDAWLIRLPTTKRAGRSCKDLNVYFVFSQGCRCKENNVILYHM